MSANVETMFSVRETPWHGLGTIIEDAPISADAIRLAGLDWTVEKKPIFDGFSKEIPNYFANTRMSDNSVLGIVGDRYKVVQNSEAFDFTDSLVEEGLVYETAGSLKNGKTIWLLARLPEKYILGDEISQYICFTNSHDGLGSIKVCLTPTRVVCNNTLNLALSTAKRMWRTTHAGDIKGKLAEAKHTLQLAESYMDSLNATAETMALSKISKDEVVSTLDKMFPVTEKTTDRAKKNIEEAKSSIMICMLAPDLANFVGTKWQFLNAVADYSTHHIGDRITSTTAENHWGTVFSGQPILDRAYSLMTA